MRLTADVLARAPAFLNVVSEREIDLSANNLPAIHNLALTNDAFDSIDLSRNHIARLECHAVLKRLKTLLLAKNRVATIANNLKATLPNLTTLVLTDNKLATLRDLEPLAGMPTIQRLSLVDNPVTKLPGYREHVISLLPGLRLLDFKRVSPAERSRALGSAAEVPAGLEGEEAPLPAPGGPTPEQVAAYREAVTNATSLSDVERLEKRFQAGDYDFGAVGTSEPPACDAAAGEGAAIVGRQATMVEAAAPAPDAAPTASRTAVGSASARGAGIDSASQAEASDSHAADDFDSLKVLDLKKLLRARGLSTSGKKRELVMRLKESRLN